MKQNTPAVYLQISTAQGPAECRIFARFVLGKLLAEAQAKGIDAELVTLSLIHISEPTRRVVISFAVLLF